jgi:hypothetical protein
LSGIAGGDRTIEIDQQQSPDDYTFDSTLWEDLDIVGVVGGTLTVRVDSSLTGDVVADAVRIERLSQPEIELIDLGADEAPGGGDDQLLFDGQSTVDFGTVNNGGTATRTFEVYNRGDVDLTLGQLRLPVVFSLLSSPSTPVAAGGMTTFQVEFAPPRVDTFSGELRLANNDSNKNPFSVTLIGEAVPVIAIIDNFMEAGYSEPGGAIQRWTGQGFAGGDGIKDVSEALPGGTAQSAVWTFTGLSDNTTYRVSTTWTAFSNRATDAPYTIGGIDGPDVTFDINQRNSPNDFTESGVNWEDLAIVRTDGTTLTITLTDLADGNVIADAIRIEELPAHGPEIQLSASGFDVADGAGSISLSGAIGGAASQTIDVVNMGTSTLTLNDATLQASLATIPGFSSPGFVSTMLAPGAATTFDVVLDTSVIGNFGGTVSFDNNDADETPYTFTISGDVAPDVIIVDNDGPNASGMYVDSGNLQLWGGQGYLNDVREAGAGGVVETATYTFPVTLGGVYQVAATWTAFGNRATDAPYAISGVTTPATVDINQRQSPDDFNDAGAFWEELGTFTTTGTTLTVVLSGATTGNVIADAVRIERISGPEIDVTQGGDPVSDGGLFDFGTAFLNSALSKVFTIANVGADPLDVGPTLTLPVGFTLGTVSDAMLFDGVNIVSIAAGGSETFELIVDTTMPGMLSGVLSFGNNDADESPFNLTLNANIVVSQIIDNDEPGFTSSPSFGAFGFQGFQGTVRAEFSPNGGDTATWTFSGLGATAYRVSATWSPFGNRADNAEFTITSTVGGGDSGPILINQKPAPSNATSPVGTSVMDSGATFADLVTTYMHTGGDLVVTLSDTGANGWIIADGIRVAAPGMLLADAPLVEGQGGASPVVDSAASIDEARLEPFLQQAIGYWTAQDASNAEQLNNVEVYVRDLPSNVLGLGSFAVPQIWLDDNGAGYGWQVDPVGTNSNRVDLLSVLTHELGHVLGYADVDPLGQFNSLATRDDVMAGVLPVGQQRGPSRGAAGLLAATDLSKAGLNQATYRSAADRLFDQYALRDPLLELTRGGQSEQRLADDETSLSDDDLLSDSASRQRPQADDRLLARGTQRLEHDLDEVHDDFFAALGDESVDQKEGSELLDE